MKSARVLVEIIGCLASSAARCTPQYSVADLKFSSSLSALPEYFFNSDPYKAEPFITDASRLQALGKERACRVLTILASETSKISLEMSGPTQTKFPRRTPCGNIPGEFKYYMLFRS